MTDDKILDIIIELCDDVAWERRADEQKLFAYTAQGSAPEKLTRLAEAFGLMLVKVEGRDLHNTRLIEQLSKQNKELEEAKAILKQKNIHLIGMMQDSLSGHGIIGQSPKMQECMKLAGNIARNPINTMLLGETGTGKEVFAKYIHFHSPRRENPFVPVNCTAIPESLFESEMFGIEKGVATGVNQRKGLFEEANGGTIFLDELADMSLVNQAKLLRVLEEKEIYRVGSAKAIPVDVKVISATNVNLQKAMQEGKFREDLYYRLAVAEINIPPLRKRGEDILLLAQKFLDRYCRQIGRELLHLSEQVKQVFLNYEWKGNVRELNNEMERLSVLCFSGSVEFSDLSLRIQEFFTNREELIKEEKKTTLTENPPVYSEEKSFNLEEQEVRLIREALDFCQGNRSKTAKLLGITREGLRKKLLKM
jgi:transcriptional regulator with PAS, ATPase and Fis domain